MPPAPLFPALVQGSPRPALRFGDRSLSHAELRDAALATAARLAGATGPPKGALLPRRALRATLDALALSTTSTNCPATAWEKVMKRALAPLARPSGGHRGRSYGATPG